MSHTKTETKKGNGILYTIWTLFGGTVCFALVEVILHACKH